jgi:hypothetical protein
MPEAHPFTDGSDLTIWSLRLSDTLRLDIDPWSAMAHLSYLQHPHSSASTASTSIGILGGLWAPRCRNLQYCGRSHYVYLRGATSEGSLEFLWCSGVYTLHSRDPGPSRITLLQSGLGHRRFDYALCSIRKLAEYWSNAGPLAPFFGSSNIRSVSS